MTDVTNTGQTEYYKGVPNIVTFIEDPDTSEYLEQLLVCERIHTESLEDELGCVAGAIEDNFKEGC